jgi:hypothetical protein
MADFSKQYCELHDSEIPHDFDILEIADGLEPEHYTSIICEGFGFLAIGKDTEGKIILAFRDSSQEDLEMGTPVIWKQYDEVVTQAGK